MKPLVLNGTLFISFLLLLSPVLGLTITDTEGNSYEVDRIIRRSEVGVKFTTKKGEKKYISNNFLTKESMERLRHYSQGAVGEQTMDNQADSLENMRRIDQLFKNILPNWNGSRKVILESIPELMRKGEVKAMMFFPYNQFNIGIMLVGDDSVMITIKNLIIAHGF